MCSGRGIIPLELDVVDPILYPNNIIPAGWHPKRYEDFMVDQGFMPIYGRTTPALLSFVKFNGKIEEYEKFYKENQERILKRKLSKK